MKPFKLVVALIGGIICSSIGDVILGNPTLIASNANLPRDSDPAYVDGGLLIDASFATVKRDANNMNFYVSEYKGMKKFYGPITSPFQTLEWSRTERQLFPNDPSFISGNFGKRIWIPNMYQLTNGDILGFAHIEDYHTCKHYACAGTDPTDIPTNFTYRVGLAYSKDAGLTWKYTGDIIKPSLSGGQGTNVGGVPYLVVGNYFYVYYNDYPNMTSSVARALITDVVTASQTCSQSPYTNCPQVSWKKFNDNNMANSGFNENALTGVGSNIVPLLPGSTNSHGNFHSDAMYSSVLKKYFITVQMVDGGGVPISLNLYSSQDGINWGNMIVIDSTANRWSPYSSFVGLTNGSNDCRTLGSTSYLMYPRSGWHDNDYYIQDLYTRKLSLSTDITPSVGFLAQ
ncbi:MAG: hypothetical protein JWO30_3455 [Fibrobacteres bacterium]|nr:hypothetical protein [Fibrobacterota bacterium]